jgi:hypothetical protein
MGKTYKKQRHDDDNSSGRSGKHAKHANGRKTGGMKTLNNYVDLYDDDETFSDEVTLEDTIEIQHTTQTK